MIIYFFWNLNEIITIVISGLGLACIHIITDND